MSHRRMAFFLSNSIEKSGKKADDMFCTHGVMYDRRKEDK